MSGGKAERPAKAGLRRKWYWRRDVVFIAFVAAVLLAWQAYGRITGPARLSDGLSLALAGDMEQLDLLVTAKFPPERFHSNVYSDIGIQRGTEGRTTVLARVARSDVLWLSRQYWIDRIELAPSKGS